MALKSGPWAALPGTVRLLLAAAGGLVTAAAFPPPDRGVLAFAALVPVFVAMAGTRPRRAAWLGYVYGLVFFGATIPWVINTMTTYGHLPLALSLLALALLTAVLAGYPAAFGLLVTAGEEALSLPGWLVPVAAALVWTGLEIVRTFLFSGFPWALLGYTQYRQPTVRLLAAAGGVYAISALLVLVNAAAARLVLGLATGRWRQGLAAIGVAALALLATGWYGNRVWQDPTGGDPIRVGLLQGNIDQGVKWDQRYQTATLGIYERLAREVAVQRPALVVWPETAVPFFLRYDAVLGGQVLRLAGEIGVPMLVGSPDQEGRLLYNSAFLVMPDGTIRQRYDKRHLVPFGEYVPLKPVFFFLDKLVVGIGDFGRGQSATVFRLEGVPFSVMICYEAIFPDEVWDFTRAGARLLVNITNDAWFGRSGAPYQHLAMAAMRAVENGSYLIRAANTGISAVIAPTGEIVAQTPLFRETSLVGTVRLRQATTPFVRSGGAILAGGASFLVVYSVVVVTALWRRRRSDGSQP